MKLWKHTGGILFYILVIGIFISATYLGSQVTSTIAQMIPMEREYTIIIDPGHGGEDGGATSCTGVSESRFNLEISLRLRDLLHLLGYQTRMIRTADVSIYAKGDTIAARKVSDLKERVRIVNETESAVLVSIHQNTFPEGKYSGAQIFYSPKGEGKALAEALQATFTETVNPGSHRSCKKAEGIYLMQHIEGTGVLVECGFLSNPQEEAKLRSPAYQKQIAQVIGTTLAYFLSNT